MFRMVFRRSGLFEFIVVYGHWIQVRYDSPGPRHL